MESCFWGTAEQTKPKIKVIKTNRGYYTVARRYEFYVWVARTISHEWAQRTRDIFSPPCNILYIWLADILPLLSKDFVKGTDQAIRTVTRYTWDFLGSLVHILLLQSGSLFFAKQNACQLHYVSMIASLHARVWLLCSKAKKIIK